jgi:hypothetical protein
MIHPQPAVLEGNGIRLEPMTPAHEKELAVAVADGALWELWYVATPTIDGKLLLLGHAFDTLGCKVVGLRTDGVNFRSQRAIEALGAKKDGVIRHAAARKDGSPRDVVMYSILRHEWPDVRRHLESRLRRHGSTVAAS